MISVFLNDFNNSLIALIRYILFIFLFIAVWSSCNSSISSDDRLMEYVPSIQTNILFENEIVESDTFNILLNNYIYNGSGVGIGDFNGDGLEDVFFAGNVVDNALYLNKGNFEFSDVSVEAGIVAANQWCSGVNVIDINQDNRLDIIVTTSFHESDELRKNLVFINQGNSDSGIPIFVDKALDYGIIHTDYSTHSICIDYDLDGDLDLYVLNNKLDVAKTSKIHPKIVDGSSPSTDRLYENQLNETGQFIDVSTQAGVVHHGFSLGAAIIDINQDNYPDLYISNDFVSNDLLLVNNQEGSFTNEIANYSNHQSFSSMGNDVADINNDGLRDIYTLDMLPREDSRMKMMFGGINHYYYDILERSGYQIQYARNCLLMNQDSRYLSDVSMMTDLDATDWSWTALFVDFDHDGNKDLFVSNGFPRDITDLDFSDYHSGINLLRGIDSTLLASIPRIKLKNHFFQNKGDLNFIEQSESWIDPIDSYSSGGAYADLDNDGDLDLVVSNINDKPFVIRNNQKVSVENHYLAIRLDDINSYGAELTCYTQDLIQKRSLLPNRGYCSTSSSVIHFGLGEHEEIDSIEIKWPDGSLQTIQLDFIDTTLTIVRNVSIPKKHKIEDDKLFALINNELTSYTHKEPKIYDFNVQPLLLRISSEDGPSIAVGDLNGDDLDDVIIGSSVDSETVIFIQSKDGSFAQETLSNTKSTENRGILIADLNGDECNDIYLANGSSEFMVDRSKNADQLFYGDCSGQFVEAELTLDSIESSAICAADFDADGDLDLFIGSSIVGGGFPKIPTSRILINDKNGLNDKTDIYLDQAEIGMITSAVASDVNNDGWIDIVLVGKWMPITMLINKEGQSFETKEINNSKGLWNSILPIDIGQDGDMDFLVGNHGKNVKYNWDSEHPIKLYFKDFDKNGSIDFFMSHYVDGVYKPYHVRNDLMKQFKFLNHEYKDFASYSEATTDEVLSYLDTDDMGIIELDLLEHVALIKEGESYVIKALPIMTQLSSIYGMSVSDINDKFTELAYTGNEYAGEVFTGNNDASVGGVLRIDQSADISYVSLSQSGWFTRGNTKGLATYQGIDQLNYIVTRNDDTQLVLKSNAELDQDLIHVPSEVHTVSLIADRDSVLVHTGLSSGYLSQSTRTIAVPKHINEVIAHKFDGSKARIYERK